MRPIDTTAIALAFWLFITLCAIAGILADYFKRDAAMKTLRTALDRGQTLSPEIVTRLLGRDPHDERGLDPQLLQVAGIITIASGVGVGVLSVFLVPVLPLYLYPVMGVGIAAVCVGAGLLIAARILWRNASKTRPATDSAE